MKRYYMACLDLEGRRCVVVGGGTVAHEKALGLLDCGAQVTVVAPDIAPELRELDVELRERAYEPRDLDDAWLVVAATDDELLNRLVFVEAESRRVLCNVVDVPELCSFILPAVHRIDPIAVAVSTGGASPVLAQRIRDDVAAIIGPEHADLALELRALRPWAKENLATYEQRRRFFAERVAEELG